MPYGSTNDYVSYFVPLGYSLYGVTTQLIRKHKPENGGEFNNPLSLSAGQTFNFRELAGNPKLLADARDDRRPRRLFARW